MSQPETLGHGARRDTLVRQILTDVFSQEFEPEQRMRVEHLGEKYGVSATPVREALVELASLGVVHLKPNKGAELRPFGPRQLREIYQVRQILESEAIRRACGRIALFELEELENEFIRQVEEPKTQKWWDKTQALDSRLHDLIAERCGNERLAHEIDRYCDIYLSLRNLRHAQRKKKSDFRHVNDNVEHLEIVRALLANDAERSAHAMTTHIESAALAIQNELFDTDSIAESSKEPFLQLSSPR